MSLFHKIIPAMILWILFSLGCCAAIILEPFIFLIYKLTDFYCLKRWLYHVGKAKDCVTNAAVFFGKNDETVSNHAGRLHIELGDAAPRFVHVIRWFTELIEENHIHESVEFTRDDPLPIPIERKK